MAILSYQTSLIIFLFFINLASSTPPEEQLKCSSNNTNCTITNSIGAFPDRSICRAAEAAYPTGEEELISWVAKATMKKRKIKVATLFSHSFPKLVCPDDEAALIISTKYLNKTLKVDMSNLTMTFESGVLLRKLITDAAENGMALGSAPYWWGLSIGGMLSTGAHGSTLWGMGSAVHDYVIQVRIVIPAGAEEGYAKVVTIEHGDPDMDAAKVSLGVLGVISQVTFKLQPLFKRSISYVDKSDGDIAKMAGRFGRKHEFGDIAWYPSMKKAIYRIDDRVPSNTPGNGTYDNIGFRSTPSALVSLFRTSEETAEATNDAEAKCTTGAAFVTSREQLAFGLANNGTTFTGYPVIGYHNNIQSSGSCLDSPEDGLTTACPWDPRITGAFFHSTGLSIKLSKVKGFIGNIQKLVALEPKAFCGTGLYDGLLMRYVTASSAYLGKDEDAIDFDISYYRSKDPLAPRLYEDIFEEIEQMALFKYKALPHWGKNRNVAFVGAIGKYRKAKEFLKVKEKFDPMGLFSNEWTDQILGLKKGLMIYKKGCALEGLCICVNDIHCAPERGYFCRHGRIYKKARVCTRLVQS